MKDVYKRQAYWSRYIYYNRYAQPAGKPYRNLLALVRGKDYFVITTNVDHQFQLAGFDKRRLFYTQGDYGLWPVSYTHLDVYKRQLLSNAGAEDIRQAGRKNT